MKQDEEERESKGHDEKRREQATEELTMKEYDLVSRQHLRDLRQNANIEYRK